MAFLGSSRKFSRHVRRSFVMSLKRPLRETNGSLTCTVIIDKVRSVMHCFHTSIYCLPEALLEEHTTRKKIPHCTRSHILYNHTVVGGLRAGNFTKIAEVDSIETCAALCCAEKTCDLALMLGENCYAGDCASKELCKPIAAQQSSQIAYITSRKAHDNSLGKFLTLSNKTSSHVMSCHAVSCRAMSAQFSLCTTGPKCSR